jgi:hypothetical protein
VAYDSDETGRYEVYVDSYPTPGRKAVVSRGAAPTRCGAADGRELYYWQGDQLVAARLDAGRRGRAAGRPRPGPALPLAVRAERVGQLRRVGRREPLRRVTGGEHTFRLVVTLGALPAAR